MGGGSTRRFAIAGAAAAVLLLANAAAAAASGWSIQQTRNPSASDTELWGVSCASASACTAVGNSFYSTTGGVTLAERWNGTKWSTQKTPNPTGGVDNYLFGVSCTLPSACTAVGNYFNNGTTQVTLAERWNGTKWSIQKTPNPTGETNISMNGVSCASASACTAVGSYSTDGGTTYATLAERWNGTKWSIQKTPNPTGGSNSDLKGVSCASANACTAVGEYNREPSVMLVERWNGTKWSIQKTPNPTGGSNSTLRGVSCASASACTAVGDYYNGSTGVPLAERWNGTKWSIQKTPNPTGGGGLDGVSCPSASACTAVGFTGGPLAERWNGTKWSIQKTPNPTGGSNSDLKGVSCASASACTGVGVYFGSNNVATLAEHWTG